VRDCNGNTTSDRAFPARFFPWWRRVVQPGGREQGRGNEAERATNGRQRDGGAAFSRVFRSRRWRVARLPQLLLDRFRGRVRPRLPPRPIADLAFGPAHARRAAGGGSENRREVEVVRDDDEALVTCPGQNLVVRRRWRVDRRPVDSLEAVLRETAGPAWRQIHVNQQLHRWPRGTSTSSARQAA